MVNHVEHVQIMLIAILSMDLALEVVSLDGWEKFVLKVISPVLKLA